MPYKVKKRLKSFKREKKLLSTRIKDQAINKNTATTTNRCEPFRLPGIRETEPRDRDAFYVIYTGIFAFCYQNPAQTLTY